MVHGEWWIFYVPAVIDVLAWSWSGDPMWMELAIRDRQWTGYKFKLTFRDFELARVEVDRGDGGKPLSAHLLQRVPLGAIERAARRRADEIMSELISAQPEAVRATAFPGSRDWHDRPPDAGDDRELRLARLAKRYVETLGQPQQARLLAEWSRAEPERGHYSESSIPQLIREARKRGLLTATRQGRPGGWLTPSAFRVLGESPPKRGDAWSRATKEWRAEAVELDRRHRALEAELLEQRRAGTIDAETFARRGMEIDAAMLHIPGSQNIHRSLAPH